MVVDVCGHVLTVVVHSAGLQDFHGARQVFQHLAKRVWPRLRTILADGIYKSDKALPAWLKDNFGWELEIVQRAPDQKGFQVLPKRWVVERTFAWLGRQRRLSKDYEFLPQTTETWIYAGMVRLLLKRLTT